MAVRGLVETKDTAAYELWRRSRCNACVVQRGAQHAAQPADLRGARLLSVKFGGSLIVWAAMISVTLVSLCVGYFVGGRLADSHPNPRVLYLVLIFAATLGMVCPRLRQVVGNFDKILGLSGGALAASAVLFASPLP